LFSRNTYGKLNRKLAKIFHYNGGKTLSIPQGRSFCVYYIEEVVYTYLDNLKSRKIPDLIGISKYKTPPLEETGVLMVRA
jgi:hypothetical protein